MTTAPEDFNDIVSKDEAAEIEELRKSVLVSMVPLVISKITPINPPAYVDTLNVLNEFITDAMHHFVVKNVAAAPISYDSLDSLMDTAKEVYKYLSENANGVDTE